jgi:predicted 3-demethylubiquinone-9 3-methyltransferase (glyoxalase superfamily)
VNHYGDAGAAASGQPKGKVMTVGFELDGQAFLGLNGGPHFQFSPATSFILNCDTQAEIDELWEKLCAGGAPGQCGWLTDKFGLSWQVVPRAIGTMMTDPNPQKSERVMAAVMQMTKIQLDILEKAYQG